MRKFKVTKKIILSFLTSRDQYDMFVFPEDDAVIEFDGTNIYLNLDTEGRHKSITTNNAIDHYLKNGYIEEI